MIIERSAGVIRSPDVLYSLKTESYIYTEGEITEALCGLLSPTTSFKWILPCNCVHSVFIICHTDAVKE